MHDGPSSERIAAILFRKDGDGVRAAIKEAATINKERLVGLPPNAATWPAMLILALDLGARIGVTEQETREAVSLFIDLAYRVHRGRSIMSPETDGLVGRPH